MIRHCKCVYFDCGQNENCKAIPFDKLVKILVKINKESGIEYALNKLTTIYDVIFYKAVEASKCLGSTLKNVYMKFEGRPPRKFDVCFKINQDKNTPIDMHLKSYCEIVISFRGGELKVKTNKL